MLAQQMAETEIGRRLTVAELRDLPITGNTNTVMDGSDTYKVFDLNAFLARVQVKLNNITNPSDDAPTAQRHGGLLIIRNWTVWPAEYLLKPKAADLDRYQLKLGPGRYELILRAEGLSADLDPFLQIWLPELDQTFSNDDHALSASPVQIDHLDAALTFTLNSMQQVIFAPLPCRIW